MTFLLHLMATTTVLLISACSGGGSSSAPSTPGSPSPAPTTPTQSTASLTVTFAENPTPFRTGGCSFTTQQGWYTEARIQERGGVSFTPTTLTQRLDGNTTSLLNESFGTRFGACPGSSFTPGVIAANGVACGTVGICTTGSFGTYQFSIAGTDANGRAVTVDSPVLQLGAR